MAKIFELYNNKLDRVWYDSSSILYSECDDVVDRLKILRITFKNGNTYEYRDVNVNDYMIFKESQSNGKAFFKHIKHYETNKLDPIPIEKINEWLEEAKEFNIVVGHKQEDGSIKLKYQGNEMNVELSDISKVIETLLNFVKVPIIFK